jgi:hypothetical protein
LPNVIGSRLVLVAMVVGLVAGVDAVASAQSLRPPLRAFDGPPRSHDLDLSDLVPAAGRLDSVWYVPSGRSVPQVAIAWHFPDRRPVVGWADRRRYVLTLWSPEKITPGSARWVPHTLIRASPFPIVGRSVRLADVTGDGHDDLLVTVMCADCNHAVAAVSVYATFGRTVRRIYGSGVIDTAKGPPRDAVVHGRVIVETAWGARHGLVWFDTPWGRSASVCCHPFRMQTFMRWTPGGWNTVVRRRVRPGDDQLVAQGYPAP